MTTKKLNQDYEDVIGFYYAISYLAQKIARNMIRNKMIKSGRIKQA